MRETSARFWTKQSQTRSFTDILVSAHISRTRQLGLRCMHFVMDNEVVLLQVRANRCKIQCGLVTTESQSLQDSINQCITKQCDWQPNLSLKRFFLLNMRGLAVIVRLLTCCCEASFQGHRATCMILTHTKYNHDNVSTLVATVMSAYWSW